MVHESQSRVQCKGLNLLLGNFRLSWGLLCWHEAAFSMLLYNALVHALAAVFLVFIQSLDNFPAW